MKKLIQSRIVIFAVLALLCSVAAEEDSVPDRIPMFQHLNISEVPDLPGLDKKDLQRIENLIHLANQQQARHNQESAKQKQLKQVPTLFMARPEQSQSSLNQQQSEHTGQQPPEHTGQQPPKHTGQQPPEHTGQQPPEHTGQQPPEHIGQQPPEHIGQQPPEHIGQQPPEHTGQQPPEHIGQQPQFQTVPPQLQTDSPQFQILPPQSQTNQQETHKQSSEIISSQSPLPPLKQSQMMSPSQQSPTPSRIQLPLPTLLQPPSAISSCTNGKHFSVSFEGIQVKIIRRSLIFQGCNGAYHRFTMRMSPFIQNSSQKNKISFSEIKSFRVCRNTESNLYISQILSAAKFELQETDDGKILKLYDQDDELVAELRPVFQLRRITLSRLQGSYIMSLPSISISFNDNHMFMIDGCNSASGNYNLSSTNNIFSNFLFSDSCIGSSDDQIAKAIVKSDKWQFEDEEECEFKMMATRTQSRIRKPLIFRPLQLPGEIEPLMSIAGQFVFYFQEMKPMRVQITEDTLSFEGCNTISSKYTITKQTKIKFSGFYADGSNFCENENDAEYVSKFHEAYSVKNGVFGRFRFEDEDGQIVFANYNFMGF